MYDRRQTKRNSTNPFLLFLLFVFIIASVSAGIFSYMQFVKVNELNATINDNVTAALVPVKQNVDILTKERDDAISKNTELEAEIKDLQEQIEELKKNLIIKDEKNIKIIYLTFDDGPSRNTEDILDILDEHAIKATFFVLGVNSEFGKNAYKNIADRGHTIGIHGYSHVYKDIYADKQAFIQNVDKLADLIYDAAGYNTNILRFPGGSNNTVNPAEDKEAFMQELIKEITAKGYTYYDWNIDSTDTSKTLQDTDVIVSQVTKQLKGRKKSIVLMHDVNGKSTTIEALKILLPQLLEEGYIFRAIDKYTQPEQFLEVQMT